MEEQRFSIEGRTYTSRDPALQDALARVYDRPERPRCMCQRGGIEMYVAKHRLYVVKRMPDTGHQHHATCVSYEPELGQSGLGELIGEAIIERSPESIELCVDFPLSRVPGRTSVRGAAQELAEINAPRHRMSLRAVMHFLFERAGFNRWYPAMEGKRTQGVMHKYLLEAAEGIQTKGVTLSERLYVPEQFHEEHKSEIAERRRSKLAVLQSPEDDVQFKMALVLGEYKGEEASPLGRKVWLKHMPDAPLFIDAKTWERIERAYGELARGPGCGHEDEAAGGDVRADLCEARAHLPDRHRKLHADHRELDSHRRDSRGRSHRGFDRAETSVHEAAALRRPQCGVVPERASARYGREADRAACGERLPGSAGSCGQGEGAQRRKASRHGCGRRTSQCRQLPEAARLKTRDGGEGAPHRGQSEK